MDFNLIIKTKAKHDLKTALNWYKLQRDDLAKQLLIKVDYSLAKIRANPFHFQERYKGIRIAFTKTFPYGIYFTVENDTIFVHAILHNKQNPEIAIRRSS